MLDINFIRENQDKVKEAIKHKQLEGTVDVDEVLALDKDYITLLQEVEELRASRNKLTDAIAHAATTQRLALIEEASVIKKELTELEPKLTALKEELDAKLLWIPNIPAEDVPVGEGEDQNVVLRQEGELPSFEFTPKDHMELGEALAMIDTQRGAKIGGFRGYFLANTGTQLHRAILQYALDFLRQKDFTIMEVPWLVKPEHFIGTGYFPWGEEDHYSVQDGLALIGTAEVSLTSYYADEVLAENDLPVCLAGISPCYRREVGSYGKDTKGVFRVHQFTKVEQVVLLPEGEELSRQWHEKLLSNAEEFLKSLDLPYQIKLMCTGDMGASQRKKYDIETWFPAQRTYRETHSDSYFLDFQARRLNMKYKTKKGEVKYINTLNNTLAASPRLLAAVMENYQEEDGSIRVPNVLQSYMNGLEIIR